MTKRMQPTLDSFGPLLISKADFEALGSGAFVNEAQLTHLASQGWLIEPTERKIEFREHWSEWMAFREFVQNSLDAAQSFCMEYDPATKISYVIDDGPGFGPEALLLGSEKAKNDRDLHCLRGVYGEGMKVAFQPFLKNNKRILIRTRGADYTFLVTHYRGTQTQVLVKLSRPNNITTGTCIAVENVDCRLYEANIAQCLPADDIILTVVGGPNSYDDCKVRQVLSRPGDIFFRDIFVKNMNEDKEQNKIYLFGYNFWFDKTIKFLGPDRTRFEPEQRDLAREVAYILRALPSPEGQLFFKELMRRWKMAIDAGYNSYSIFEFDMINAYTEGSSHDSAEDVEALRIMDGAIKEVFEVKEYSGITGYDYDDHNTQRKTLEHLGVANLENYLPRYLLEKLSKHKIVKSGKEWQAVEDLSTVSHFGVEDIKNGVDSFLSMPSEEFQALMQYSRVKEATAWAGEDKYVPEAEGTASVSSASGAGRIEQRLPQGLDIKKWKTQIEIAYSYLLTQLRNIAQEVAPGVDVKIFDRDKKLKTTEIDKVGGFFDQRTIWIKLDNLINLDRLLRVFIHELAHAMCAEANKHRGDRRALDCSDLNDDFETYLVKAGMFMFKKSKEIANIDKRLAVLNQNGYIFFLAKKIWGVAEKFEKPEIKASFDKAALKETMVSLAKLLKQLSHEKDDVDLANIDDKSRTKIVDHVEKIKKALGWQSVQPASFESLALSVGGHSIQYGVFFLVHDPETDMFDLDYRSTKKDAWTGRIWKRLWGQAQEIARYNY